MFSNIDKFCARINLSNVLSEEQKDLLARFAIASPGLQRQLSHGSRLSLVEQEAHFLNALGLSDETKSHKAIAQKLSSLFEIIETTSEIPGMESDRVLKSVAQLVPKIGAAYGLNLPELRDNNLSRDIGFDHETVARMPIEELMESAFAAAKGQFSDPKQHIFLDLVRRAVSLPQDAIYAHVSSMNAAHNLSDMSSRGLFGLPLQECVLGLLNRFLPHSTRPEEKAYSRRVKLEEAMKNILGYRLEFTH